MKRGAIQAVRNGFDQGLSNNITGIFQWKLFISGSSCLSNVARLSATSLQEGAYKINQIRIGWYGI